jgi:hypothetical protein
LLPHRLWDAAGENLVEHIAGVEDFQVAQATYRAAVERWPGGAITLRQDARVIEDSRRTRLASWADEGRRRARRVSGLQCSLRLAFWIRASCRSPEQHFRLRLESTHKFDDRSI